MTLEAAITAAKEMNDSGEHPKKFFFPWFDKVNDYWVLKYNDR